MTLTAARGLAALVAAAVIGPPPAAPRSECAAPPDPMLIRLVPTAHANGASGEVRLHFAASPFGVSATRDGRHDFTLDLTVEGLAAPVGTTVVVWAATPDLGRVHRLGVLGADGTLESRIALNKFLVFLTAEPDPGVERWTGPVLLRGSSPSGRMHSMAGHGPFESEPCGVIGF
ncbi:MAG TPA: hypothetical protein VK837_12255 [Longimicrobiales bacterium]|nr:hypothetical protein [Longimicrobiales bacterium]